MAVEKKRKIFKSGLKMLVGGRPFGWMRFRLSPHLRRGWGGPFNGQAARCMLMSELIIRLRPAAIVETGTYLGTTTEWLAAFQVPIYTCELSDENYGFSKARLDGTKNVQISKRDSRTALREILAGPLSGKLDEPLLFYLDAHWNDDLPLADEMEIIFSRCRKATVVIDDFQVPHDAGYGFDNYGAGKALIPDYVAPSMSAHGLKLFYPATASEHETGARRGCAVLVNHDMLEDGSLGPSLLRPAGGDTLHMPHIARDVA